MVKTSKINSCSYVKTLLYMCCIMINKKQKKTYQW